MMKGMINFGLFIFFAFSIVVTFAYSIALYEKIKRPTFKNLPMHEFVILGFVVIGLLTIDYFIIKRFTKKS